MSEHTGQNNNSDPSLSILCELITKYIWVLILQNKPLYGRMSKSQQTSIL